MVLRRAPILANKEDVNFNEALKLYDGKQFKKALKLLDQNLKKNSSHAESLALKGCILHFSSNKAEAAAFVEKGTSKGAKNYIVNHVAGIYYRAVENYAEAAKWFQRALDNGSPNKNILRDLAILQVHNRDYKNLKKTRQEYLELQAGYRANWTGLAVAFELNHNYEAGVSTLGKIEDIIRSHLQESDMYEQSECVLYKNYLIGKTGDYPRALKDLEGKTDIRDRLSCMEYEAKYLMYLGKKKEASLVYRKLLQRNPNNVQYYLMLEAALETTNRHFELRVKLYEKLARFYPKADPPKFLPLVILPASHDLFAKKAKDYIIDQLRRGVPATFVNIKPLCKNKGKMRIIYDIVLDFDKKEVPQLPPTVFVWTKFFLSHYYLYVNNVDQALSTAEEALRHSPTLVELYVLKARILKHLGKLEEGVDCMEQGRQLDLQDRFVNSKTSKYLLRANKVNEAIDCVSLFTKLDENAVNGCKDIHLMQIIWVLVESAEAYTRLYHQYEDELCKIDTSKVDKEETENRLIEMTDIYKGLALKRFHSIFKIYSIFNGDQFDFHSYCLRRGTPRDYVTMLKWEDELAATPVYSRALKGLAAIYFEIFDNQQLQEQGDFLVKEELSDVRAKKNTKKMKKTKSQNLKKREELVSKVESEKNDPDPLGLGLLSEITSDNEARILDKLFDYYKPLPDLVKDNQVTWNLGFELYLRQKKYVLCVQAIKSLRSIAEAFGNRNNEVERKAALLFKTIRQDNSSNKAVLTVSEKSLLSAFPELSEKGYEAILQG